MRSIILSNRVAAALLGGVFGSIIVASTARADVPACPASLGSYTATVQGNNVIICPMPAPISGTSPRSTCPFTTGMVRRDVATGATQGFVGPCVADPQNDAGDAGTPCYLDSCVAPGTYEYGYQLSFLCSGSCAGQTGGEYAVVATTTSPVSSCTPPPALVGAIAPWPDAGIEDGAVRWSGICHGPLPDPDGGSCAWNWAPDGSPEWAPCPPDGGSLCPGYESDGAVVPVLCAPPLDGGAAEAPDASPPPPVVSTLPDAGTASTAADGSAGSAPGNASSTAPDAAATSAAPLAAGQPGNGSDGGGGGCSAVSGVGVRPLGPLVALSLVFAIRAARRKRRERKSRA